MSSTVTFSIPGAESEKLKERIRREAIEQGLSMSEWIVNACAEALRKKNGQ